VKILAHYDSAGTIHSLIMVNAPAGASLMPAPKPGLFVAEVEGLELKSAAPHTAELREIAKTHKVATPPPHCTLAKKK
jgi:hypothetical protein